MAGGLAYAHARGIVRRDIKPSNLLLDTEGVVWIADFGLAKGEDEGLTQSGDILGTLRYMAPERFRGEGDAWADDYAPGLALYELLTLRPGFESPDRLKLIEQIKTEEPTKPRSVDGRIPRDLETIVLKAIEKDPKARYQTAEAMGEDLRRFLADEPIRARRTTAAEHFARWARRNKGLTASLSAIALLTVAVAIGSTLAAFHFQRQEQTQKELAANNRTLADQREAARRLANARADEIQQNLYWAEMNLAVQAAERERGIGRLNELLDHWRPTPGEADRRGWEWYYLRGVGQQALLSWPHRHVIKADALAWNPDGRRLASGGEDREVKLWDAATGREIASQRLTSPKVREFVALSWSPDSHPLASASRDGTLRIWDGATGRELLTFPGNSGYLIAVSWSPDGRHLAGGGDGRTVTIWDPKTGRETATLRGHTSAVTALAWSPDSRYLASAIFDQTLKIWEPDSGRVVANLRGHTLSVTSMSWSPDGRRLASGGYDSSIMVWEMASGLRAAPFRGHQDATWCVSWSPDGRRLASSSLDHTARIWDAATGRSWDKTIRIWDATRGYTAERSPALLPILERRLAVQPQKPEDLQLRAGIRARLGRWDEAASDWTRAAHLQGASAPQPFQAGWWVLGPIATTAPPSAETDVEPDSLQPVWNGTPGASNATGLHWRAVPATPGGALDLGALFPNARFGSAHALLRVYALREQPVTARLGSSSSYRFWLNGRPVHEASSEHPQDGDDERMPLTLRDGWNTLLFHVTIGTEHDWLSLDFE